MTTTDRPVGEDPARRWDERDAAPEAERATPSRRRPRTAGRAVQLLERLTAGLPAGERRDGQVAMAGAVERAISSGACIAVEAPTGTGKSLAYLAGLLSASERAVVATSSIALQDQLVNKDLPFVAAVLEDTEVTYAVLKGRSNYLCLQRVAELAHQDGREPEARLDPSMIEEGADERSVRRLVAWAATTDTGDRAELSFEPSPAAWGSVSVTGDECPGAANCPRGRQCFAEHAHWRAAAARIVVVNTHLYAMHVASGGHVLPEHDTVVFDEGHEVEAIFSAALGSELTPGQVRLLGRSARRVIADDRLGERIDRAAVTLADALRSRSSGADPDASPDDLRLPHGAAAEDGLAPALVEVERVALEVKAALGRIQSDDAEVSAKRERTGQLAASLMKRLDEVRRDDVGTVVWREGWRSIRSAPLDVGLAMRAWLFSEQGGSEDDDDVAPPRSAIFTSATLPANLIDRLRVPRASALTVESPFDYRSHSMLYVPDIPDPKQRERWQAAVLDELAALVEAAGGRTLALFTSIRAMRESAQALAARVAYPVLVQGEVPKATMIEALRSDPHLVLAATRSFFQGVDIPGQNLSVVALDRIPFPRPGDPLTEAWQEAAGGGFSGFAKVAIPLAAITLAQAAGRLIRTSTDLGVVAVLDSRLATAGYRRELLARLPPMKRTRTRGEVVGFLERVAAAD